MGLEILFTPAFLLIRSRDVEPLTHRHLPTQVSFARKGLTLTCAGRVLHSQACCIDANVPHLVESQSTMLTYLVAPAHPVSQVLRQRLGEKRCVTFETDEQALAELETLPLTNESVPEFMEAGRGLWRYHDLYLGEIEPLDERVARAIDELDQVGARELSARQLAELVSLSESRFLHLFKEELEFTLRAYRLWQRVLQACHRLARGTSVTEAAHQAGFTDAAHFASSFKRMFGFTPTQVFGDQSLSVVFVRDL